MPTLVPSLSRMVDDLTDLIESLPDGSQRNALVVQHEALAERVDALVGKSVKENTPRYVEATAALERANESLVEARADIRKVAETITKIAEVVGVLGELAANLK